MLLRRVPISLASRTRSFSTLSGATAALKGKIDHFFLDSIKAEQADVATALLKEGVDVNTCVKGVTALHVASQLGSLPMTELLLAHTPSLNPKDNDGYTPLLWACNRGHFSVVSALASAGADLTVTTPKDGLTVLHHAAVSGDGPTCGALLAAGADPSTKALDGATCVHAAIFAGKDDALEAILAGLGLLPSVTFAVPASSPAASDANAGVKEPLTKEEAKEAAKAAAPSATTRPYTVPASPITPTAASKALVELENTNGLSPLFIAAYTGRSRAVSLLLSAGADATRELPALRVTPLAGAAAQGHAEAARALLQAGAKGDIVDGDGLTPRGWAKSRGHKDVEAVLDEFGIKAE